MERKPKIYTTHGIYNNTQIDKDQRRKVYTFFGVKSLSLGPRNDRGWQSLVIKAHICSRRLFFSQTPSYVFHFPHIFEHKVIATQRHHFKREIFFRRLKSQFSILTYGWNIQVHGNIREKTFTFAGLINYHHLVLKKKEKKSLSEL